MTVRGTNKGTGEQTIGKLNLIDLAGSERVGKSGALEDATRLKEATSINKSLACLGDVINALGAKQKHVPYRNSKLTHLLSDSLGGKSKTLMMVQISPVEKNVGESLCSLKFGRRVKAVELGAAKKTTESANIASLKKRVRELEGKGQDTKMVDALKQRVEELENFSRMQGAALLKAKGEEAQFV